MDLTYAVADLHGSDDLLVAALAAIERHAAGMAAGRRAVVFLGDYVDRGPDSCAVIARLRRGPPAGWRWLCLKGNHEDMMLGALRDPAQADVWIYNGGDATLRSYGDPDGRALRPGLVPADDLRWIEGLPPIAVDRHRVFVHAGVDPERPLTEQDEHALLWSRAGSARGHAGRVVVHGHTPHPDGPVTVGLSIDLDTLAWRTGRLVVGVFDDDRAGGPIDLVRVERARRWR